MTFSIHFYSFLDKPSWWKSLNGMVHLPNAMNKEIIRIKKIIVPTLMKNYVVKAGIFGSYARVEQKKTSDVDILIKFKGQKSLLDHVGLQLELRKKLKKNVDVLTYHSLNPLLKNRILKEEVRIL